MQIGIDSFALAHDDASLALTPADHATELLGANVAPILHKELSAAAV